MENLEIIILTSILSTLFIVFFVLNYRIFSKMDKNEYKFNPNDKKYGRDALFVFMQKFFEDDTTNSMTKKEKQKMYNSIKRTIADMESDGVYFPKKSENNLNEI